MELTIFGARFCISQRLRQIAVLGFAALTIGAAHAQSAKDPTYHSDCKQNSDNPGSAYECKRINPKSAPYKYSWQYLSAAQNGGEAAYADTQEEARDKLIEIANADYIRRGDYYIRLIVNPIDPTCVGLVVVYSNGPSSTSIASVAGYCNVWAVNTAYPIGSPGYILNDRAQVTSSTIAFCEAGWTILGYPLLYGSLGVFPHICVRGQTSKELGEKCPSCGNPINIATGNKYQVESDYAGSGPMPLQLRRHYNSAWVQRTIDIGNSWRLDYDRKLTVEGTNSVWVTRPDGKLYFFILKNGQWTPDSEVNDTVAPVIDALNNIVGWQYTEARTLNIESYSATGQLLRITDRAGSITTLQYSDASTPASLAPAANMLIQVSDPLGRSLSLTYNSDRRVASIADPSGGITAYGYDATGNLTSVMRPDGRARIYLYNEAANNAAVAITWALTGIIDENNSRLSTYKYSADGRAYSTEWAGGVNKFTVDAGPTVTDPLGLAKSYLMALTNQVKYPYNTTQPCASSGCTGTQTEIRRYDINGNLTTYIDLRGVITSRTFDLPRNLEIARTEAASTTVARTITTTWHPTFRIPASITEPTTVGTKVTSFTHDLNGNVLSKSVTVGGVTRVWAYTYDSFGRVLTATDPRNNTTTNTYYPNEVSQGTTRGMLASVTNAAGHTTTITSYNAHGQPLSITDANGLTTTMGYDPRQRLTSRTVGTETTTYEYDGVGQLTKVTLPDNATLRYTYDGAHRLVEIKDGLNNRVVYTLDNMGNRTKEEYADPANALTKTRSRAYDALNRLQKDIGGVAGQVTQFAYDANGNQTGTTDPLSRTTTQTYDALNRLLQVIDPVNGGTAPTKYEYDPQDNLTKVTDPKNLSTVYVYNGFNELTSQVSPDTGTTSFIYDAAGNMLTKTDARGVTATYSYDALNRVNTISYPAYGGDAAETVTYNYDTCSNGKGRLCSLTDKTGTTSYSYDNRGRILAKSQTTLAFTQTVGYGYNGAGQMDRMTLPSGKVVVYTYVNNRVTAITYDGKPVIKNADYEPFGPIGEWTWGNDTVTSPNKHTRYFDLDGRTTNIESGMGTDPSIIVYDAASRITALQKLTGNAIDPAKSTNYGYDNLDRLINVAPNAGNTNPARGFSYDGVGNRLTATLAGSVTNYNYSASSHRLNSLTGATAKSFSYDNDGNRLTDGMSAWTYGGNNRPTLISVAGSPFVVQAGINALGQRVNKTVSGSVTRFMYDEAGRLIGEYDIDGKARQETLWFNDLPVAVIK